MKPEGYENGCSSLKGRIHAAEAGLADSLFLVGKAKQIRKEKSEHIKQQT
jgi:hypothetical protein